MAVCVELKPYRSQSSKKEEVDIKVKIQDLALGGALMQEKEKEKTGRNYLDEENSDLYKNKNNKLNGSEARQSGFQEG